VLRLIGLVAGLAAAPAGAHAVGSGNTPAGDSVIFVMLFAAGALHAFGTLRLWHRAGGGRGLRRADVARWWAGWLLLAVALLSPLDEWAERLFWVHMVQHELLMVAAAPLLVMGRPLEAWAWALAPAWRAALARWRAPALRRLWSLATSTLGAWLLHAAAIWAWHAPRLFEAALRDPAVHALQHTAFLGTALLFWHSVLPRAARVPDGTALASAFTTMLHTGGLGALLTFASSPWYAVAGAGGISALEDQQLGGLVMWLPGSLSYLAAGLLLVAAWLRPSPGDASMSAAGMRDPAPRAPPHRA
jgi:putative membrane protein